MASKAFVQAVQVALQTSSTYGSGSLLRPSAKCVPEEQTRGLVPPPLTQWVLQADAFQSRLVEEYQKVNVGETRMLVAATGIGKTTKLPIRLVSHTNRACLVLLPDPMLVASVVTYVSDVVLRQMDSSVKVLPLRSAHIQNPPKGAIVYYCAAEDFLPRFHADRGLITRMNIDFVYLDEAHTNTPAYYMMRMFVGLGFFHDTKVFCGTATCAGNSLKLTSKQGQTASVSISSTMFPMNSPDTTPVVSPLHHTKITGRFMIFLATDESIDLWEKYYDKHDISVLTFKTSDTSTKEASIERKLRVGFRPIVFLTCSRLQTGYTFDIDGVICCGYTQYLHVDYSVPSVTLKVRTVSSVERAQRLGRADRHLTGMSYYNNVQLSPDEPELNDTSAIYVWLWARMFNVVIKSPVVSQFDELLYDASDQLVSLMLCSKLHPVLVLPYLSDDGELFRGWEIMRHVFHTQYQIPIGKEMSEDSLARWKDRNTGPQPWLETPVIYKSMTEFPVEWQALPAAAWLSYTDTVGGFDMDFDNRSVVSALTPEVSRSDVRKTKTVVAPGASSTTVVRASSRPRSVMTVGDKHSPIEFDVPTMPRIPETYLQSSLMEVPKVTVGSLTSKPHQRSPSNVTEEVPRAEVTKWLEQIDKPKHRRRASRHSSSSSSSHDRMDVRLKKVDAVEYKMHKLFPMDKELSQVFTVSDSVGSGDNRRYKNLLLLKKNFSNLGYDVATKTEDQSKYFMSVLRLHNLFLMEGLQIKASGRAPVSFMDRLVFGKEDIGTQENIDKTAKLLSGMQLEGFFVGVDERVFHGASEINSVATVSRAVERARAKAAYYLLVGDPALRAAIELMDNVCYPLPNDSGVVGTGWYAGAACFTVKHTADRVVFPETFSLVSSNAFKDYAVFSTPHFKGAHPKMRGPVDEEEILFVGYDLHVGEVVPIGPAKVCLFNGVWCVDMVLDFGYSGFALVSVSDASMVGIYRGFYMTLTDGTNFGHFTPTTDFLNEIATIYKT